EPGGGRVTGGGAVRASTPTVAGIVGNPAGAVTAWKAGAEQLFGWRSEEVIGRQLPVVPADSWAEFVARLRAAANDQDLPDADRRWLRRDGRDVHVRPSTSAIRDGRGRINGLLITLTELRPARPEVSSSGVGSARME